MQILNSCLKKGIGQLFLKEGIKGFDQRKRKKSSWLGIQERSTFLSHGLSHLSVSVIKKILLTFALHGDWKVETKNWSIGTMSIGRIEWFVICRLILGSHSFGSLLVRRLIVI